jgi:uncharacterized DUF497 family protein
VDAAKATENLRKHGIDFRDSIAALEDPNRLEEIDSRFGLRKRTNTGPWYGSR